jgi:hypothetical protein
VDSLALPTQEVLALTRALLQASPALHTASVGLGPYEQGGDWTICKSWPHKSHFSGHEMVAKYSFVLSPMQVVSADFKVVAHVPKHEVQTKFQKQKYSFIESLN